MNEESPVPGSSLPFAAALLLSVSGVAAAAGGLHGARRDEVGRRQGPHGRTLAVSVDRMLTVAERDAGRSTP